MGRISGRWLRRGSRIRLAVLWSLVPVVGVAGGLVALAVPAQGGVARAAASGSLPANCVVASGTATCTFAYTGVPQPFVVPAGVSSIVVRVDGAQGNDLGTTGGDGGIQAGTLAVTGGETLEVFVGGQGSSGGYNGGGGDPGLDFRGGSGGGASDIRTSPFGLGDRVVVAGGGGGHGAGGYVSGPTMTPPGDGGVGGAGGGDAAAGAGGGTPSALGGGGGGAGGAVGSAGVPGADAGADGTAGGAGSAGQGGPAGPGGIGGSAEWGGDGGGGGGGYVGGAGGGGGAADDTGPTAGGGGGGGGGSSYILPSAANPSSTTGVQTGDGAVRISFAVTPAEVTSATGASFPTGIARSFKVTATGLPTPALSETGVLPAGVTFTDNGDGTATITGTAASSAVGSYPLTITAASGVPPNATQSFTLVVPGAPSSTIGAPGTGGTYSRGASIPTVFRCADAAQAPGLSSCTDSNGHSGSADTGSGSTGAGTLNTSALGFHTYAVTATSRDGQTARASISYAVIGGPTGTVKIKSGAIDSAHQTATFSFKAIGTVTTFRCALIRERKHHKYPKPSFASCHSPKAYRHLKPGNYRFEVEAVGGKPVIESFRIKP